MWPLKPISSEDTCSGHQHVACTSSMQPCCLRRGDRLRLRVPQGHPARRCRVSLTPRPPVTHLSLRPRLTQFTLGTEDTRNAMGRQQEFRDAAGGRHTYPPGACWGAVLWYPGPCRAGDPGTATAHGQGPLSSPCPPAQAPSVGTHLLSLQPCEAVNAGVSLEERRPEM